MLVPLKKLAKLVFPGWLWSRLQSVAFMREYRQQITSYNSRITRRTYGGIPLSVHINDPVAERWYDKDWADSSEIVFLQNHRLRTGARVFDIGAHQCVVALMLAKIVGPTGSVVAVEANPHNAAIGLRNRDLNQATQLEVVHAAAGEKNGQVVINELLNGQVDRSKRFGAIQVPCLSLDDLASRYGMPDVLLLDVEGFECQVLRGAREILASCPDWCVEVHVASGLEELGGSVAQVLAFFPSTDYELFMGSGADPAGQPEFVKLEPNCDFLRSRFFLIAIGRARPSGPAAALSGQTVQVTDGCGHRS
jgi:FkbM family methyltransferase